MDVQLNRGYHNTDIPKGEFGKLSKITEEYLELVDANAQGVRILELNELADLIGAVEGYAETLGFTLSDLIAMKDRTAAAFASGERKSAPVPVLQAPDDAAVQGYTIQCIGDIDGISICCATSLGHFSNVETLVLSTTLKSPRVAEHKLRIVSELKSFTGNVSEQARARYYASELQIALHQTEQDRIWRNVCFLASAQEQGCAVLVLPRDKRNGALGWKHCTSGSVSIMVPADAVACELLHSEELAERERED